MFGDVCVLESSDVEDNEEFLLLQKRTDSILNLREQDLDQGSPSANEVFQRTKHIPITQSSTTPAFNLDSLLAQSDVSTKNGIYENVRKSNNKIVFLASTGHEKANNNHSDIICLHPWSGSLWRKACSNVQTKN